MATKNLQGKTVTRENAYEVWQTLDGSWTWYVLKKYQSPEKEAENPYARWFCDVTSPFVGERGELGDVYVRDIVGHAVKIHERPIELTLPPKPKRKATRRKTIPRASVRGLGR